MTTILKGLPCTPPPPTGFRVCCGKFYDQSKAGQKLSDAKCCADPCPYFKVVCVSCEFVTYSCRPQCPQCGKVVCILCVGFSEEGGILCHVCEYGRQRLDHERVTHGPTHQGTNTPPPPQPSQLTQATQTRLPLETMFGDYVVSADGPEVTISRMHVRHTSNSIDQLFRAGHTCDNMDQMFKQFERPRKKTNGEGTIDAPSRV